MDQLKSAFFFCHLLLFQLVGCSTLGPGEHEAMLIGKLSLEGMGTGTSIHHLEAYGSIKGKDSQESLQRFYGVWFERDNGAFSIPVPWHPTTESVTIKRLDIYLTTPLGEQQFKIDVNLEVMAKAKLCFDLGDWSIDVVAGNLLSMKRPSDLNSSERLSQFQHCPRE